MSRGTLPGLRHLAAILLVCGGMLGYLGPGTAQAASTQNSALILCSTTDNGVDPGTGACTTNVSLEQQEAVAAGFTNITLVDDQQWENMTTADFEQYQLIILGDPANCAGVNTAGPGSVAQMTASVWEPAVMSSGGNKVLIGDDPTYHYVLGQAPDAPQLERQSLGYAGAVAGATGVYLDLNCAYGNAAANTPVSILNGLSTHGTGQFTAIGYSPVGACGTGVNIVASTGPTSGLTDADLSNWSCSVQEAFDTFPSDYTPLAIAPSSSGFPSVYCANDAQTNSAACGSPYIMVSGGGISVTSNISLSPSSQRVPTSKNNSATVTATVSANGLPESGKSVTFNVDTGPNTGQTKTATTNSSGQVSFTYNDNGVSGTDSISASFRDDQGNIEKALASVTWVGPINGDDFVDVTSSNVTVPGVEGVSLGTPTLVHFTDTDQDDPSASNWTASVNWGDGSSGVVPVSGSNSVFSVAADHTYASPGDYTIQITLTDNSNPQNTDTVLDTATVVEGTLASQSTAVSATEGQSFSGQVATFTDQDLGSLPANYTATIHWGDGNSSAGQITGSNGSFAVSGVHTYADAGSYPTSVTISEADAASVNTSASGTATVAEAPINVTAQATTPIVGSAFTGTVATFTDGDPGKPASAYTAQINWGDGASSSGTISGSGGSFSVTGTHTFASTGDSTVTVTVQEAGDASTAQSGGATASVADAALTATGKGTITLPSSSFSGAEATFTDGNTTAPAGSYTTTIDWGDGSSGAGTVTGSGGNFTVSGSHTFPGPGVYTAKMTVSDGHGASSSATTTFVIPSASTSLAAPASISAKQLFCGIKKRVKCAGLKMSGTFPGSGGASWQFSAVSQKSGKSVTLGTMTETISGSGAVAVVFKVGPTGKAKKLYKRVKKGKMTSIQVVQSFTNAAGGRGASSASVRLTR